MTGENGSPVVDHGGWRGHDPDVIDSLAQERNGLAWQRTAIAWLGSGAATVRYFSGDGFLGGRASVGWLMLLVGALVWLVGAERYHRYRSLLEDDHPVPVSGRTVRLVGITTSLTCVAALVAELASS